MPSTGLLVTSWKNSGTIWVRPPMLTASTISSISRPTFFSIVSCFITDSSGRLRGRGGFDRLCRAHGAPCVVSHQQHAAEEHRTAHQSHDVARVAGLQRFDEGVGEGAVIVDRTPHKALGDAVDPHRGDVEHGADGG